MLCFIDIRRYGSCGNKLSINFDKVRANHRMMYRYKPLLEPYDTAFWTCMAHYAVVF